MNIVELALRLLFRSNRLFISCFFTPITFSSGILVSIAAEIAVPRLHHAKRSILHNQPLILTPLNFNHFRINLFLFLINGGQVVNFMCLQFDLHKHRLETDTFDILEVLDLP